MANNVGDNVPLNPDIDEEEGEKEEEEEEVAADPPPDPQNQPVQEQVVADPPRNPRNQPAKKEVGREDNGSEELFITNYKDFPESSRASDSRDKANSYESIEKKRSDDEDDYNEATSQPHYGFPWEYSSDKGE